MLQVAHVVIVTLLVRHLGMLSHHIYVLPIYLYKQS